MTDDSHLDLKYFIDTQVYNCPFCNRRNVKYEHDGYYTFDWSRGKTCYVWFIKCSSCHQRSMHLTFDDIDNPNSGYRCFTSRTDIDSHLFYSVPTSFFVVDSRIPAVIRELITEAEGCIKMNYLTGASACTRKAIYELLVKEGAEGDRYDDRIKDLQSKQPDVDPELFEVLAHIKDMTNDKVHEQSWDKWDPGSLKLILETLKTVLHEIYVVPDEKAARKKRIKDLKAKMGGANTAAIASAEPEAPAALKGDE